MSENFIISVCAQTMSPDSIEKNTSLEISPDFEANKRQMGIDLKQAAKSTTTMFFSPPRKKL